MKLEYNPYSAVNPAKIPYDILCGTTTQPTVTPAINYLSVSTFPVASAAVVPVQGTLDVAGSEIGSLTSPMNQVRLYR